VNLTGGKYEDYLKGPDNLGLGDIRRYLIRRRWSKVADEAMTVLGGQVGGCEGAKGAAWAQQPRF